MAPVKSLLAFLSFLVLAAASSHHFPPRPHPDSTEGTSLLYRPLMEYLRTISDPAVIPITQDRLPVKVKVGMSLLNVADVDEERGVVEIVAWSSLGWKNPALAWDPKKFSNVTDVRFPAERMWVPDFTFYNAASPSRAMSPQLTVLNNDGSVTYIPSINQRFTCDVEGVYTSTGANCTLKLGSWTYSGFLLSLDSDVHFDLSDYIGSSKYDILSTAAERTVQYYPCCPEPYESVEFSFVIRTKNADRSWYQTLFDDDDD